MLLKPKYDNHLAGVGGGAKVAVANGNILICKHDSKLKLLQKICVHAFRIKQNLLKRSVFCVKLVKRSAAPALCRQNARFQSA